MSGVTNVILVVSGAIGRKDEQAFIDKINLMTFGESKVGFKPCDVGGISAVTGGSKHMLDSIYMGGFNFLDKEMLIRALKKVPWDLSHRPISVCIIYRSEYMEEYDFMRIYPE